MCRRKSVRVVGVQDNATTTHAHHIRPCPPCTTARGGKKKRFRHRESSFLRTPKIPASQLSIADVVCPLRDMPYSQQLLVKQEKVIDALTMLTKKVGGVVLFSQQK